MMLIGKRDFYIGLLFVFSLALFSHFIVQIPFLQNNGISSLIIAILVGMLIGNSIRLPSSWVHGVQFAAKRILRLAIILYGFRISLNELIAVGGNAFIITVLIVAIILLLGYFFGQFFLKLDRELTMLISIGAAICGAAAVLALEDIFKSEAHKTSVAIATVVIFGTLSMFLYPLLQHGGWLHFSSNQFGIFAGASIHEVAQVVVAGSDVSELTGKMAVVVKMMRVILLIPVLLLFSYLNTRLNLSGHQRKAKIVIPWFAFGFLVMILVHSLLLTDTAIVSLINHLDTFLLTMAMGAIGLETKWAKIKHVGLKPFYLAMLLMVSLFGAAYLLVACLV